MKRSTNLLAICLFVLSLSSYAQSTRKYQMLEIRSYNLKPGSRDAFHKIVVEKAIPLLQKWKIELLDYGPSLHDNDSYFVVRGFESVEDRQKREDEFYGSEEWKNGPREEILSHIINYTDAVFPADSLHELSRRIRQGDLAENADDHEALKKLNAAFINNFLRQDAVAHAKIIHPDFICIESNGQLVSRETYLKNWATDFSKSGYKTFAYQDEKIRIFGNIALVRSKTVYTKDVNGKTVTGYTIYTDTYHKENGEWKCIQVQITPVRE